ncbi:alanine--tRNA ligase [candidate division KSB3 bacterium]|uniref:Alanine--tRNA ligase n=1 Tax=candidate division KSB3 bacterium TaxID=2044937 RepID=A0A9D5JXA4_9BACT|nr:alanine--tRNA ligase [candidate division KSB3 bacterium]MBD3325805.1 alanine--tRNA ligase [candidate division KSB3 bacterium]
MTGHELRQVFLEFFQERGHAIVPSSSLVPQNDPTLLFTNAGMVQFKDVFLGAETREYRRATTAQRCVRAGGKHNDLENVGRTARHHTFFEMMGNFSFGDYFKREAIQFGWDFLTKTIALPPERLWATVYEDDDQAFDLWQQIIGLPETRIIRMGEKDNFWAMGDTGPCGPCSEIIIDQGEEMRCGPNCGIGQCDCDRYLELWNLVFMQFDRDASGTLTPLPKPSIDTGMGLERVAAVLQGVRSNFDTDLFTPMLRFAEQISGKTYGDQPQDDTSMRVIADHLRSTTFLISDGVLPSNEGRGYVLRRIMRRAARHGKMLGVDEPFLYQGVEVVVDTMKAVYREIADNFDYITQVTLNEERRFGHTLNQGIEILNTLIEEAKRQKTDVLDGTEIFRLYDTFGFPVDLTQDIARDHGLSLDMEGFEREMQAQRTRAREAWKGSGEVAVAEVYKQLSHELPATRFTGYDALEESDATILALVKDQHVVEHAAAGENVEMVVDVTPCYGEAGGQIGDMGRIHTPDGETEAVISDTTKPVPQLVVHHLTITKGSLRTGQKIEIVVDSERRKRTRRNHTTTHLLHAALREVLGDHVKQSGSLVTPDRFRFDFTHFSSIDEPDMQRIETIVNRGIQTNTSVQTVETTLDNALDMGAIAFFEEKYGDQVRIVQIPGISMELCGGTHAKATGEIGLCKLINESSIAAGVRRIEALTGEPALQYIQTEEHHLQQALSLLKASQGEFVPKVEKLLQTSREYEREIERLKMKLATLQTEALVKQAKEIDGVTVLAARVENLDAKGLRNFADVLKGKIGSGIVVLGTVTNGRVTLISAVTKDMTNTYHAGHIIKEVAAVVNGSGGGRPDMAQAGGKTPEKLSEALEEVFHVVAAYSS